MFATNPSAGSHGAFTPALEQLKATAAQHTTTGTTPTTGSGARPLISGLAGEKLSQQLSDKLTHRNTSGIGGSGGGGAHPFVVSAALVAVGSVAVASQAPAHPVVVQVAAGGKEVSPTLSANTTYAHSWAHNVDCRRTPSGHGHYCQSMCKSNSRRRSLIKQ